jgi:hypothetical protein
MEQPIFTSETPLRSEKVVVLKADNIYTSNGNSTTGYVVIRNGLIASVSETLPGDLIKASSENNTADDASSAVEFVDITGHWIAPGFVDLHNHGCGGKAKVCWMICGCFFLLFVRSFVCSLCFVLYSLILSLMPRSKSIG